MEKKFTTGTILIDNANRVISINHFVSHLLDRSEHSVLLKDLSEVFDIKKSVLYHSDGTEIPVFYEKHEIYLSDEMITTFTVREQTLQDEDHPIYSKIIHNSSDSILILSTSGDILFCNQTFLKHTGFRASEIIKAPIVNMIDEKDVHRFLELTNFEIADKDSEDYHLRINSPNKNLAFTAVNSPVFTSNGELLYIIVSLSLIDAELLKLDTLMQKEQRFKSLFNQNPDFVFSLDLDFCFVDMNDSMLAATGFGSKEILERPFTTLVPPEEFALVVTSLVEARKGKKKNFDTMLLKKDARQLDISLTLFPIFIKNELVGLHGIAKDISAKKEYENTIYKLAYTDTLTALPNRALFHQELDVVSKETLSKNGNFALLFFDIDNFKNVNDTLGHLAGDDLLVETASRIKNILPDNASLFRMGGDEFTIILKDFKSKVDLKALCYEILGSFKDSFIVDDNEVLISSSIGVACFPADTSNVLDIVRYADSAMYHSKSKGKNYYSFFDVSMVANQSEELRLNGSLRKAIDNDEFHLHYQPIVNVETRKISSAEALIRWYSSDQGIVSPGIFIPLAEVSGLINVLGNWVVEQVCWQISEWLKQGYDVVPISINVSGKQFERQDVFTVIKSCLEKYNIPAHLVTIEVTESVLIKSIKSILPTLHSIKELGCGLAIDDFGYGYSSLSYLKEFPVNKLKMDRAFILDIVSDTKMKKIVNSIVELGHVLDLEVIAEGVETEAEYNELKAIGTDSIQGYLFSKPLSSADFAEMFLRNEV